MSKNIYKDLSNETLIKKRTQFKGLAKGFGIVLLIGLAFLVYILINKGGGKLPIATLIPLITLPITFLPVLININLLNKEIKSRNI